MVLSANSLCDTQFRLRSSALLQNRLSLKVYELDLEAQKLQSLVEEQRS